MQSDTRGTLQLFRSFVERQHKKNTYVSSQPQRCLYWKCNKVFVAPKRNQGFVLPKHNLTVLVPKLIVYFAKLSFTECLWFWAEFQSEVEPGNRKMTAVATDMRPE